MSLKLSPGCTCCPPPSGVCPQCCSSASEQTEYDVILSGLIDGSNCSICETLNDTFTVNSINEVTPPGSGWGDGWSGMLESKAADVPYGATHACVWTKELSFNCYWNYTAGDFPPLDYMTQRFDIFGILLAKFRITDSNFVWRLIVVYKLLLRCSSSFGADNEDTIDAGWYWELSETTNDCSLSGSETWTSNFPTVDLSVSCVHTTESDFADYCGGSLSLTSVVDG